jgi:cytochrome P450
MRLFDMESNSFQMGKSIRVVGLVWHYVPKLWLAKVMGDEAAAYQEMMDDNEKIMKEIALDQDPKTSIQSTPLAKLYDYYQTDSRTVDQIAAMLRDEAATFQYGGTESPAFTLTCAMFYLCKHPEYASRLNEELKSVMPRPDSKVEYVALTKLTYLQAFLKEALRLSFGAAYLPRTVPKEGMTLKSATEGDIFVPGYATLQINSYLIHTDPSLFPDPMIFNPERWLKGAESKELEKFIVSFSGGPARCLGIEVAHIMLNLAIAGMVRRFNITGRVKGVNGDIQEVESMEGLKWRDHWLPCLRDGDLLLHFEERTE